MIIDDIHDANIQALKDHDTVARSILSVVLTKAKLLEVELRSQNLTLSDEQVLDIIQKTIKELHDEKDGYAKVGNAPRAEAIDKQEAIIKEYLPQQLTREEITAIIASLSDKSLPNIMKYFKTNYFGKVNMSLVSEIARSL